MNEHEDGFIRSFLRARYRERCLAKKGIPVMAFAQMKPWAVATQLAMLDYLVQLQMGKQPLDSMLYSKAEAAGKEVGGVEKVEEQLGIFDGMSAEEQVKQLEQALDQYEKAAAEGVSPIKPLLDAYLSGDLDQLVKASEESAADPEDPDYKKLMEKMVDGRMKKFTSERALLAQPYVKDPSKTVEAMVGEAASSMGTSIKLTRFERHQIGG